MNGKMIATTTGNLSYPYTTLETIDNAATNPARSLSTTQVIWAILITALVCLHHIVALEQRLSQRLIKRRLQAVEDRQRSFLSALQAEAAERRDADDLQDEIAESFIESLKLRDTRLELLRQAAGIEFPDPEGDAETESAERITESEDPADGQ